MTAYRQEFNVTAASTAIRQDFRGVSEYVSGVGGVALNATNTLQADVGLNPGYTGPTDPLG